MRKIDLISEIVLLVSVIGLALHFFAHSFLPEIHGWLRPVSSRLEKPTVKASEHFALFTHVAGELDVYQDCVFVGQDWYWGERNNEIAAANSFFAFENIPPRGVGRRYIDGLYVNLTVDMVWNNSHADLLYKCPNVPWLIKSPVWPPEVAALQ